MIHTVRSPFMCREGQFGKGRKLVVGISLDALHGMNTYKFKIGKNPKIYEGGVTMIKESGYLWENNKGKSVYIIPVEYFDESS
tara:strand:+ start:648 stop:896 length:249 start_codon:yes stop_codon:yes gene_type:complete